MHTCISCKVIFANAELQREHYKSDWHRYNLKRKVAQLPPVTKEEFEIRAAAHSQISTDQKEEASEKCQLCHKTFVSKNSFLNHLQSRKHLEAQKQLKASKSEKKKPFSHPKPLPVKNEDEKSEADQANDEEWETDSSGWESCDEDIGEDTSLPSNVCLFCSHESQKIDENLQHMTEAHSFFIPDAEYLVDLEGLIVFLGYKVGSGHVCLWCEKSFRSIMSVQQHMLDKGHCKLLHEGEALISYGDFYDYSASYPEGVDEGMADLEVEDDDYQLVLPSGATIGHRSLALFYKQNLRPQKPENTRSKKAINSLLQHYRALGWTGTTGEAAVKKARDLAFMRKVQSKLSLKLSVKANKLQHHFRQQVVY